MTPELWTVVGIVGAAVVGAAAGLLTVRSERRKTDADTDNTIVAAAKSVVEILHGELDAMRVRLTEETARCNELARRVAELERLLKGA